MQVSVIIASYNRGSLILDTLASLNAQTLTDAEMEVLIVGDGSSDGSGERVADYLADCPRRSSAYFSTRAQQRGKPLHAIPAFGLLSHRLSSSLMMIAW